MLDEKDLQAIAQLLAQQKTELKDELRKEIMQDANVLIESDIMPKFNLLADAIQGVDDKLVPVSQVQALEDDVHVLKLAVRAMSQEIAELKKAQ